MLDDVTEPNGATTEVRTVTTALERVTDSLTRIEERLVLSTREIHQRTESLTTESEVIRWLDDEDLTGRLQAILRRQARRHGIDLSG